MFSKKLNSLDFSVKNSLGCCCFAGRRSVSPPSDEEKAIAKGGKSKSKPKVKKKNDKTKQENGLENKYGSQSNNAVEMEEVKKANRRSLTNDKTLVTFVEKEQTEAGKTEDDSGKTDGQVGKKDSDGKKKEKVGDKDKKKNGAAYAYDESDSSSDSDDEVLKHYQSTLKPRNSIHRSETNQSMRSVKSSRSAKVPMLQEEKSGSKPTLTRGDTRSPQDSSSYDDSHSSPAHEYSINLNANQDEAKIDLESPGSTDQMTGSMTSQQQTTYENRAYTDEPMSASAGSETLSRGGVMATDEHLFDVSDLEKEPVLISKCGSLEMTFSFDPSRGRMAITIHQAQDIPSKDRGGASNCQVRMLLLPTKKQRYKTKVKSGENPVFNENFTFSKISPEEVHGMGIRIRLYGLERMRRERMIGESIIGFASLNLDLTSTHWIILEPRSNLSGGDSQFDVSSLTRSDSASSTQSMQHGGMPELLLGLAYNGTTGRLSVEVVKGSNFRNMAMNRAPDTYVKLTLMSPTGQEVARSKTSIRRGQPNPLFKETFMFQVALFQLADVTLMVSVYNKRSMKKKDMIGWFSLGLNSSGEEEQSHWSDMRESKGEQVCRWHVLLES
ncbi:hypothetical protein FSP39_019841 [Pinctada imbricata]|uniref:C2 domain-containing protein n=1 Tax=Pinctada imbricata TaxID=66713 RepID=A0AA89BZR4_PINIB|nr:hypothetical protein FSP39_019841 [Pinctada imbricata]